MVFVRHSCCWHVYVNICMLRRLHMLVRPLAACAGPRSFAWWNPARSPRPHAPAHTHKHTLVLLFLVGGVMSRLAVAPYLQESRFKPTQPEEEMPGQLPAAHASRNDHRKRVASMPT